jgi:hypothetical protein
MTAAAARAIQRLRTGSSTVELSSLVAPLFLVSALVAYAVIYRLQLPQWAPERSDGEGYYAYLPAYLVYFDDSLRSVVANHFISHSQGGLFNPVSGGFGLSLQPTGNWLDKYPVGEAILLIPFFLAGHLITIVDGRTPADGYSYAELYAAGTGAAVYGALGIAALRAVLRRWFSDAVTVATLVVVAFGAALFHYATYDSVFSHAFSFAVVAFAMLSALRWYERPESPWRAVVLGLAAGAVVAVRLTDAILLVAAPLLGVGSLTALRERVQLLRRHMGGIALALACGALTLVPQVFTWWAATGHLIVQPYVGESFDFAHPHLLDSLFAFYPHGVLPYAPATGLCLAGIVVAWFVRRDMALPATAAFLPYWYLMSSWWDWSFSAGFSDRIYVNIMPVLALPLAALFASLHRAWLRRTVAVISAVLVLVSLDLMVAYWRQALPGAGAPFNEYVRLLLHP